MKHLLSLFFICYFLFGFSQTVKSDLIYKINQPITKTDKPCPLLILLHGYGSNEDDLFSMGKLLDSRFTTISLRAPNAIKDDGYCWYSLEFLADKKFKYNYKQALESRLKILSFISNACKVYKLDSNNVFVLGFSQGAIMGYDLALAAPQKIKGLLALSGRMMEESKNLKTDWTIAARTNYFIAHGNSDNVILKTESDSAVKFLKSKQLKKITFTTYEMSHTISNEELTDIKKWLTAGVK